MAQQVPVQITVKEIYERLDAKGKKILRELIKEKITDRMIDRIIGVEVAVAKKK